LAAIICPDCRKKVPTGATTCPHCGRPFSRRELSALARRGRARAAGCAALLLALVVAVGLRLSLGGPGRPAAVPSSPMPTVAPSPTRTPDTSAYSTVTREPLGLRLTPAEFAKAFNAAADRLGIRGARIEALRVEAGEVSDAFRHDFNESIGLVGSVSKSTGRIIDLAVIGTPRTDKESSQMVACCGIVIKVFSPSLTKKERGELLLSLMNGRDGELNRDKSRVVGDIRYHFSTSETVGIWFSVANRKD